MTWRGVIHNLAVLSATCFLVWATGSAWWALVLLFILTPK